MRSPRPEGVWYDRGVRTGSEHTALDAALLEGVGQPTLHLHRYLPTASLGRHECADEAIRTNYCRGLGIAVARRVAGGAALYLDPNQQCWTVAFPAGSPVHSEALASVTRRHAEWVIAALEVFDIRAQYVSPSDIEVDGRKLASVMVARSAAVTLLQGALLLDVDMARTLRVLRVPIEKLSPAGVQSARQRFVTLGDLAPDALAGANVPRALVATAGEAFGLSWAPTTPTSRAAAPLDVPAPQPVLQPAPPGAARAFAITPGGVIHAWMRLGREGREILKAGLSASVQCSPPSLLTDLAKALRGPLTGWRERLRGALARASWEAVGVEATDFEAACAQALARLTQQHMFGLYSDEANSIMLCDEAGLGAGEILRRASVMLVPYCAKLLTCKWRHRDGCPECGLCEVGDAYRLARTRGMRVVSITNFEHLGQTLEEMGAQGVEAYVGMCCKEFFLKRHYAFRAAGIPAVLLDISGANCYDLQQEEMAYEGSFDAQAMLNGAVVEKVMRFVPPRGGVRRD